MEVDSTLPPKHLERPEFEPGLEQKGRNKAGLPTEDEGSKRAVLSVPKVGTTRNQLFGVRSLRLSWKWDESTTFIALGLHSAKLPFLPSLRFAVILYYYELACAYFHLMSSFNISLSQLVIWCFRRFCARAFGRAQSLRPSWFSIRIIITKHLWCSRYHLYNFPSTLLHYFITQY